MKIGHISATVYATGTKYGMTMHSGIQTVPAAKISNFSNIQHG